MLKIPNERERNTREIRMFSKRSNYIVSREADRSSQIAVCREVDHERKSWQRDEKSQAKQQEEAPKADQYVQEVRFDKKASKDEQ